MIRAIGETLAFFAIPFVLYVAWLAVRSLNPFAVDRWTRTVVLPLGIAGLLAAVAGLLLAGFDAPRHEGGYVPAHIEGGRIVPGRMQ